MNEAWLPVDGFEGEYEISSLGRVRSLARVIPYLDGRDRPIRERVLKQTPDSAGYPAVAMSSGHLGRKVQAKRRVHVLVLTAFRGPRSPGQQGRHLNDVKSDNRLENLQWGSASENVRDMVRNGNHHYAKRDRCKNGHSLEEGSFRLYTAKTGTSRVCLKCQKAGHEKHAAKASRLDNEVPQEL